MSGGTSKIVTFDGGYIEVGHCYRSNNSGNLYKILQIVPGSTLIQVECIETTDGVVRQVGGIYEVYVGFLNPQKDETYNYNLKEILN